MKFKKITKRKRNQINKINVKLIHHYHFLKYQVNLIHKIHKSQITSKENKTMI